MFTFVSDKHLSFTYAQGFNLHITDANIDILQQSGFSLTSFSRLNISRAHDGFLLWYSVLVHYDITWTQSMIINHTLNHKYNEFGTCAIPM